jgi:hypothetical protein
MHHVGYAELAAPVANAGGLGIFDRIKPPSGVHLPMASGDTSGCWAMSGASKLMGLRAAAMKLPR